MSKQIDQKHHAVYAGPGPRALWLTYHLVAVTATVAMVSTLPALGRLATWDEGVLKGNHSLVAAMVGLFLAAVGVWLTLARIRAALFARVPRRSATGAEVPGMPDGLAALVAVGAECAVAIYAATHAQGDHGVTSFVLALWGAVAAGLAMGCLRWDASWRDRRAAGVISTLRHAPIAVVALVASTVAAHGVKVTTTWGMGVGTLLVAGAAVALISARRITREQPGATRDDVSGTMADGVRGHLVGSG